MKIQKLQNVSIAELKKDFEKTRQLQRQKKTQARAEEATTTTTVDGQTGARRTTLAVEQLDITAPLDVTSVGSSDVPPPQEGTTPSEKEGVTPEAIKARPAKPKLKPKKSVATVKLTELEMAKLGHIGVVGPGVQSKKKPSRANILSPTPAKQPTTTTGSSLKPSPKPSPRGSPQASPKPSPRPSPRASPLPPGDVGKRPADKAKDQSRLPKNEMPTRRDKALERKRAQEKGKPGEVAAEEEARHSSSERSGSRERHLSRETSKDKAGGKAGSRKQSLLELSGQSPSSRAAKNISDYGHKLVALCRKGDWVGVDTIIKYIIKYKAEFDAAAVSDNTGWSPLMFSVKDNRIQIVEQLIDIGFPINTKAKVSRIVSRQVD